MKKLTTFSLCILSILIISCVDPAVTPNKSIIVYTAGYYYNDDGVSRVEKPCYWKGTTSTELALPDSSSSTRATDTSVYGGIAYTSGSFINGNDLTMPCYWQGAEKINLTVPEGTVSGCANSIFVDNGTIYTAGNLSIMDESEQVNNYVCYWLGTTEIELPLPTGAGSPEISSIYVDNGTVYIAGKYFDEYWQTTACYWVGKDKTFSIVPIGLDIDIYGISVNNGTVYLAGSYTDNNYIKIASYWEGNGEGTKKIDLPVPLGVADCFATSIFVYNGTVYTTGNYGIDDKRVACYWENTKRTELLEVTNTMELPGDVNVNSIFFCDGNVYTAGFYSNGSSHKACYWQGTTKIDLEIPSEYSYSEAISIFVSEEN